MMEKHLALPVKEKVALTMTEFPKLINHGGELAFNYYYLTGTLLGYGRTLGVYESEYDDHPDRILHLELDEALQYAISEEERGYDGPVWG
tara:strand:+ start:653 stop:922 length:270 start_codon:yes stop_codon:yes gene_type:complete